MTDAITAIQTEILGWASPLQTSIIAILSAFLVISGIWLVVKLLTKSAKTAAK